MRGLFCYDVQTYDGKPIVARLCRQDSEEEFSDQSLTSPRFTSLTLFKFAQASRSGFLFSDCGRRFSVEGDTSSGAALSVRLELLHDWSHIEFIHWWDSAKRLSALPVLAHEENSRGGRLQFVRRSGDVVPHFSLLARDVKDISGDILAAVEEVASLIRHPLRWRDIIEALRDKSLRLSLGESVLCLLSADELQALASHLMNDYSDLQLLQSAMPNNVSVCSRIPALSNWLTNGTSTHAQGCIALVADASDLPGTYGLTPHQPDMGLALNALTRRNIRATRMACILGSARNEGVYLLEWIAHHRSVGFEHVFIYTNDNTDGSDDLLGLLAKEGVITWIRNEVSPKSLPQFKAYAHALNILPSILDYRWALVADLDEYLGFDKQKFSSVQDFLAWQDSLRADAVALPWLLHVAQPSDNWHDESSVTRFPLRVQNVNHHIKSLIRANLFWGSNPHHPTSSLGLPVSYLAETGLPHISMPPENSPSLSANPVASNAWIAHYIFRSAPEALMKIMRGKGDGPREAQTQSIEKMLMPFVTLMYRRKLVRDHRTIDCADGTTFELKRLRSAPGVNECDRAIRTNFSLSVRKACERFLEHPAEENSKDRADFSEILRNLLE